MAEATDFKFGTQLGFAKANHKITPIGKNGHGLGLGKLPYILGFPLILPQRPRCPFSISGASCFQPCTVTVLQQQLHIYSSQLAYIKFSHATNDGEIVESL